MDRRLATILAADVCGYSARMGADETATLRLLARLQSMIEARVESGSGRLFSRAGDGFLAEFQSPVAALHSAYELQRDIAHAQARDPAMLEMRLGLHLADVVIDGDDLLGDGVNVAARIEGAGRPGKVTLSQPVFDQVKRTAGFAYEPLGEHTLKNISEPVALYEVVGELDAHSFSSGLDETPRYGESGGADERPSVAVLPLANRSGDPEQDYFVDGFTEDLITELSRFSTLFVASRNASLSYRGKTVSLPEAGRHLGVDYCLEGSARRMGDRLRLSVQLSRAETEENIWADRFDCSLDEIFDVQDEIAARIVSAVAGRVERTLTDDSRRKRPSDLSAYDCVLRGLELHRLGGVTLEDAREAVKWFDKAIAIDPDYARAHAWRSCSRHALGEWLDDDWWDESHSSVLKALELDENDAEAHRIMGVMSMYMRQWDKSRHHFERALQLNPNHANVVARAGEIYNFMGEPDRALKMVDRAKRLDPFLPDYCRQLEAAANYTKGNHAGVLKVTDEMTRLARRAAAYRAAASSHMDDDALRTAAASGVLRIDPGFRASVFVKTEYYRDPAAVDGLVSDLIAAGLPD